MRLFSYTILDFLERAVWSNCRGKRLDTLSLTRYMTAKECIEMGGNCCGINMDGIGNGNQIVSCNKETETKIIFELYFYYICDLGSEDPFTMAPSSKCYSCYNSSPTIRVICTGKLVRSQIGFHQNWWVNSKNCIKEGGLCCDGKQTTSMRLKKGI